MNKIVNTGMKIDLHIHSCFSSRKMISPGETTPFVPSKSADIKNSRIFLSRTR